MSSGSEADRVEGRAMDRGLLVLLSVIAAITVGNLYIAQPLLAEIGHSFRASESAAGSVVTLSQVGYGLGVLFIVPLGDLLERRRLILALLAGVTASLLLAASAPSLSFLAVASLLVGITTVVPQIAIPYAASIAPDSKRASVLGTVQGGLLLGILLTRTFSGGTASIAGWRSVFVAAAALCALLWAAVLLRFPRQRVEARLSYPRAIASMLGLLSREPALLRVSLIGALNFAVFTSFWTTLPFLLEASYGRGPAAAGMFGIVGVVGALAASFAGRLFDRKGARFAQLLSLLVTLVSFAAFSLGAHQLAWLVIGVAVMDAGVQATHIACQAEAFAIDPAARSRINGVYMFLRFAGGAVGSALGVACWSRWGWAGFCVSGAACALASLAPLAFVRPRLPYELESGRPPPSPSPS
jgi:predicted MFS family arabinose efflux permease